MVFESLGGCHSAAGLLRVRQAAQSSIGVTLGGLGLALWVDPNFWRGPIFWGLAQRWNSRTGLGLTVGQLLCAL